MFEFERVTSMDTLHNAWQKISGKKGCAGIDGIDLNYYRSDLQNHLRALQTAVISGNYRPYAEKVYNNRKNRDISIHCIDDKIIQTAAAGIIMSVYEPSKCVHGFVKNRSIYTAKKSLDRALRNGITEYAKVDIKRFYDSINNDLLFRKIQSNIGDFKFLSLVEILIYSHRFGISTGSSLSPVLSNLYLADFDGDLEKKSVFYSRYVDDMLVAPAENVSLVGEKLDEVGLDINKDKCEPVNAAAGFTYLGFDIKATIDNALQSGDFALAEKLHAADETAEQSDISDNPPQQLIENENEPVTEPGYEMPNHIRNVVRKCHIINTFVDKAKENRYLSYPDKSQLLQIFHCLGEDGAKFIHHVLSFCDDYNYAETQRRINKYDAPNPIGCKKLCERYGPTEKCTCNFSQEKMYPTPIIHARRVMPECFTPSKPKDSIGHFKSKTPKHRAEDALSGLLQLNKKAYEIKEQQNILVGQIESLFERTDTREFQTPQGLLIKNDEGIFIKVG